MFSASLNICFLSSISISRDVNNELLSKELLLFLVFLKKYKYKTITLFKGYVSISVMIYNVNKSILF